MQLAKKHPVFTFDWSEIVRPLAVFVTRRIHRGTSESTYCRIHIAQAQIIGVPA